MTKALDFFGGWFYNCFIDYKLTVMQSTSLKEFMNVFDVAIEER